MDMWIVLCQAITFAFLISQYHFFNEVEAEEQQTISVGGWFGDLEKKLNVIKGVMHDVFQTIKRSAQSIPLRASPHRRDMTNPKDVPTTLAPAIEDITVTTKINEDVIIGPNDEEMCPNTLKPLSIAEMENGDEYASGLSQENSETYHNYQTKSPHGHHKKRKKAKKAKKKIKPKRKIKPRKAHVDKPHVEQAHTTTKLHEEKEKEHIEPEFQNNMKITSKKIKPHKKKPAKFVKTTVDNKLNDSESDETVKRGKPVDIIVHIKMNE